MRSFEDLTKEIEAKGLHKTVNEYTTKLYSLIESAPKVDGLRRISVHDEYVRVHTILNLLIVIQGGPSTKPKSFEAFYSLPEQQNLL